MGVIQCRNFSVLLYPDTESYDCDEVLSKLDEVFVEWAYILHNNDVQDNGESDKPHFHVVGKRMTPVPFSTVANKLGIPVNFVENGKQWVKSIRYLIHLDQPDKYQYSSDEVFANFDITPFLDDNYQVNVALKIIDFIYANPNCSFYELSKWCALHNYWSEYRRSFSIFVSIKNEFKE